MCARFNDPNLVSDAPPSSASPSPLPPRLKLLQLSTNTHI